MATNIVGVSAINIFMVKLQYDGNIHKSIQKVKFHSLTETDGFKQVVPYAVRQMCL